MSSHFHASFGHMRFCWAERSVYVSMAKIRIQKYLVRFGSFFTHLSYCLYRQFLCRRYSELLESEQFKKCLQIHKTYCKLLWKVSPKTLHSFFFPTFLLLWVSTYPRRKWLLWYHGLISWIMILIRKLMSVLPKRWVVLWYSWKRIGPTRRGHLVHLAKGGGNGQLKSCEKVSSILGAQKIPKTWPMPSLAKGNEQIFDSYGRRSNDELLLLYGFSLAQNATPYRKACNFCVSYLSLVFSWPFLETKSKFLVSSITSINFNRLVQPLQISTLSAVKALHLFRKKTNQHSKVHNFVEISLLDLWSQTSLASAKKTWLKVQGADVDEMQSLCLPRGYWPQEVMLLMRLLVLRPRDWKREGNLLQSLSDLGMKKAGDQEWVGCSW